MKFLNKEKNELLFLYKNASSSFWDTKWIRNWDKYKNTLFKLSPRSQICRITSRFLSPKDGPVLEGGCGMGNNVFYLDAMNYEVIGIDYAKKIVKKVNFEFPNLKILYGDIRNIPFSDNFFSGYWSFGVIEHYLNGYVDIIKEMKRVIKPKGYLFICFPYMSPFRRFKSKIHLYKIIDGDYKRSNKLYKSFYQFYLNKDLVIKDLEVLGFKLKYMETYSGIKGFKDEIFIFKFFLKRFFQLLYNSEKPRFIIYLKELLNTLLEKKCGNGILLVFQKE